VLNANAHVSSSALRAEAENLKLTKQKIMAKVFIVGKGAAQREIKLGVRKRRFVYTRNEADASAYRTEILCL
jgi:hypothetical protein